MKKLFLSIVLTIFTSFMFAQNFASVDINDKIYKYLEHAQNKGYGKFLTGYKPYTQSEILSVIDEILLNQEDGEFTQTELEIFKSYKEKWTFDDESKDNIARVRADLPFFNDTTNHFLYNASLESIASGGFYTDSDFNSWGMDNLFDFSCLGDIGSNLSYRLSAIFDVTKMPLQYAGDYNIGYLWFDYDKRDDEGFRLDKDGNRYPPRVIKTYRNNSYLPYTYSRPWAGQMYFFSNLSTSGLEGWPTEWGVSGTVHSELRFSAYDNRVKFGMGRYRREYAGMDNGASLVLNANAQPFLGIDLEAKVSEHFKFSTLTGILEYPNQDFINENSLPISENDLNSTSPDDAFFWQNAFSVNMLEADFKYIHFDFGGSVIYPKRFELGYMFPLAVFVEYQNHIGDFDNLGLFTNLKLRYPELGEFWLSAFADEINLKSNPFTDTRDMLAYQGGIKYFIPKLSFASISFRYTKVEPYCYTHHAINYTPWYNHYICENYTNGGENLGYNLPPNSDEFNLKFDWATSPNVSLNAGYKFIRHGADYGSQQVPGSSFYSEMDNRDRDDLKKYFLHDGAYNWIHIIQLGGSINLRKWGIPVDFFGNCGFMYSYYTMIADEDYDSTGKAKKGSDFSTNAFKVNTNEYPTQIGVVLTIGAKFEL